MQSYQNHLAISQAEVSRTLLKDKTLHERKAAIIRAELDLYYQNEFELLIRWNNDKNIEKNELEKAFEKAGFLLLFLEYIRLQEVVKTENNTKERGILLKFMAIIGNLNLLSMMGAFTANVLGLVGTLYTAITTAVAFLGTLVILAFAIPVALSTMIIGVGIELVHAMINPKTSQRGTVITSDLAILGLASTALMVPFNMVPAVFMGVPIVLPLLFMGIVAASYYKDKKQLEHKENLISINDAIIARNRALLIQALTESNQLNITDPTIQRLSFEIAEAIRANAILDIQKQTLSTVINTHKVSLIAVGILLASALIFPPISLAASIAGVVGIGLFLGTSLYGKKLREKEQKLINEKVQAPDMKIGAVQMVEFDNAKKNMPKKSIKLEKKEKNEGHKKEPFHAGKLFEHAYISQKTNDDAARIMPPTINENESTGVHEVFKSLI